MTERGPMEQRAVVLLSGGVDSATALACARAEFQCYALAFDYGQRHRVELQAARRVAQDLGIVDFRIVNLDLSAIGGSALTADVDVPKGRSLTAIGEGIPITYVPARNTIFLAIALGYAEVIGAWDIFMGANVLDYSGYPDCRPAFLQAFERLANLATKASIEGRGTFRIHAPLLYLNKAQIIRKGIELGVNYSLTLSCYDPDAVGHACGACDSCLLRQKGFAEAGVTDPTVYAQ